MRDLGKRGDDGRIAEEIRWCMTFEEGKSCCGAGGRKLRQTCVWCQNFRKEEKKNEKNN